MLGRRNEFLHLHVSMTTFGILIILANTKNKTKFGSAIQSRCFLVIAMEDWMILYFVVMPFWVNCVKIFED